MCWVLGSKWELFTPWVRWLLSSHWRPVRVVGAVRITWMEVNGGLTSTLQHLYPDRNVQWRCISSHSACVWAGRAPATAWSTEWVSKTSGFMVLTMSRGKKKQQETLTWDWPSSWPGLSLFVWCLSGEVTHSSRKVVSGYTHSSMLWRPLVSWICYLAPILTKNDS